LAQGSAHNTDAMQVRGRRSPQAGMRPTGRADAAIGG